MLVPIPFSVPDPVPVPAAVLVNHPHFPKSATQRKRQITSTVIILSVTLPCLSCTSTTTSTTKQHSTAQHSTVQPDTVNRSITHFSPHPPKPRNTTVPSTTKSRLFLAAVLVLESHRVSLCSCLYSTVDPITGGPVVRVIILATQFGMRRWSRDKRTGAARRMFGLVTLGVVQAGIARGRVGIWIPRWRWRVEERTEQKNGVCCITVLCGLDLFALRHAMLCYAMLCDIF